MDDRNGAELTIRYEWCKACGICVIVCPKHVLEERDGLPVVVNPQACNGCEACALHCPDRAICVCGLQQVRRRDA